MGVVTRSDVTCHGDKHRFGVDASPRDMDSSVNQWDVGIQSTLKGDKICEKNPARVGVSGVSSAETLYGVDPHVLSG